MSFSHEHFSQDAPMTGRPTAIAALMLTCAALLAGAAGADESLSTAVSGGEGLLASPCGNTNWCCDSGRSGWFAGVDYRLVRTHFSEAVAFATLTAGAGPQGPDLRVTGSELDFNYQSSFYFYAGYHLNNYADVRFSYWFLDDSTDVSGAAGPGQVIVDPFGNLAPAGTEIDTTASVEVHVFDLEYMRRIEDPTWPASVTYSAGLRGADVNQFYQSEVSAGGGLLSDGVFRVNWSGVGPYGSISGRVFSCNRRFSAFTKAGAALLVGKNNITTDVSVTGAFTGGQSAGRILVVPVLESELGASWQPTDCWRFSFGWLVQAWFDLGVSGGTFSGQNLPAVGFPPIQNVFGGADDANIMAFDGFFWRAEYNY
jgi:Legionella pneumophila major outer membrane protein precursor